MAYTIKNITGVPVRIGTKTAKINGVNRIVDDVIDPHSERTFSKKADYKNAEKCPNLLIDGGKKVNASKARVTLTKRPVAVEALTSK